MVTNFLVVQALPPGNDFLNFFGANTNSVIDLDDVKVEEVEEEETIESKNAKNVTSKAWLHITRKSLI